MARTLTRDGTRSAAALPRDPAGLALLALRLAGVGLTVAMAWIHLYLYADQGYQDIPRIGVLFLLNGIGGGLLALLLLGTPNRFLAPLSALGALFTAGTLGGLVISLTRGLFNVKETLDTPWVPETIWVESAGVLVLAAVAAFAWFRHGLGLRRSPR